MRAAAVVSAIVIALGSVSVLVGQTIDGLDLQAVKQRSRGMKDEAEAFANQVKDRGEAFREEAASVRAAGMENLRRLPGAALPAGRVGAINFDELVSGAALNASAAKGEAPQLIVFASLSMPPQSLRQLISDTARAGGVVVFRGFPDNSMKAFATRLGKIVGNRDDFANIGIDPRLFRAFDIEAVPTFVAVSSDFDLCAGFVCKTAVPPFDRMAGNVSVGYALDQFAAAGGPGARVAAVGLAALRRSAP